MKNRWSSFIFLVVFSFTTAFIWMASIIYRVGGVADPQTTTKLMQDDLTNWGLLFTLFDIIIVLLILNIIRPLHRWTFLRLGKKEESSGRNN